MKSIKNPHFSILVVCLGNTCRSPAGEYLLRHYSNQCDKNKTVFRIESAGLHPVISGMAPYTQDYLLTKKIESNHFSNQRITPELIEKFDWILVMENYMKQDILEMFNGTIHNNPDNNQNLKNKILLFSEAAGESGDIEDPYGDGRERYYIIMKRIDALSRKIINKLDQDLL